MEPGHEDREYRLLARSRMKRIPPQWSPVMKTGNTQGALNDLAESALPQWSPVMKTGNTYGCVMQ